MKKIRFIAILLTICFFNSGCTKDDPIKLKEVEDVCEQMDDITFMEYCYSKFDVNSDGKVSMTEAAAVTSINLYQKYSIKSLKGIEYFTNLEVLSVSINKLTTLDVSKNLELQKLYCDSNNLTALDLSKNVKLTRLTCRVNKIAALDLSKNVELNYIDCYFNQLTTLDVSKNVKLNYLDCTSNPLRVIYLNNNQYIESFTMPDGVTVEYK